MRYSLLVLVLNCCLLAAQQVMSNELVNKGSALTQIDNTQRVVFSTRAGDLVFALYPNLAPRHVKHFKRLVELELYNNVYVARVINNFVFQFSEIHKSADKLSNAQKSALLPIKAEFNTQVQHLRGVLSMAHKNNEPDSATSSFSVILGNAQHLDGKYTIFGELESGWSVINKIMASSVNGVVPAKRVIVDRAYIVTNIEGYYKTHPKDTDTYVAPKKDTAKSKRLLRKGQIIKSNADLIMVIAILTAVNVFIGLVALFFYEKLNKTYLRSLLILTVLVGGFTLLVLFFSMNKDFTWFGAVLFIVLVGMLRLMSRFEN